MLALALSPELRSSGEQPQPETAQRFLAAGPVTVFGVLLVLMAVVCTKRRSFNPSVGITGARGCAKRNAKRQVFARVNLQELLGKNREDCPVIILVWV